MQILKKYGGRRRKCKDCEVTFRIPKNETNKLRIAAEQWLLDRSTLQRIMDKSGISKMEKWKQVQKYANHIPCYHHYLRYRYRSG